VAGRGLKPLTPCLQSTFRLSETVFSLGHSWFGASLSDDPCRSSLWSGVVVKTLLCEQEHRQLRLDIADSIVGGLKEFDH
jgi:hypothetical protein